MPRKIGTGVGSGTAGAEGRSGAVDADAIAGSEVRTVPEVSAGRQVVQVTVRAALSHHALVVADSEASHDAHVSGRRSAINFVAMQVTRHRTVST